MPDREKVIKGLECCADSCRNGCPYADIDDDCEGVLCADAISLLKEQEAVEPDTDSEGTCTCEKCGETVGYYPVGCSKPEKLCRFCPECGQAVKWE